MKKNTAPFFVFFSFAALLALVVIQVNWIFQTARIKEALFNEKANLVLSRAEQLLQSDQQMCETIESSLDTTASSETSQISAVKEIAELDSLIKVSLEEYDIHVEYTFVVTKPIFPGSNVSGSFATTIFNRRMDDPANQSGLELKLIFPKRSQFILAEMGVMFFTSVLLILVVIILFWRTSNSLRRERRLAEETKQFINNMTHEFKTPLTNIALAGKMLVRDVKSGKEGSAEHYTGIILNENAKLQSRVEEVLNMNALELNKTLACSDVLDVHRIIDAVVLSMNVQMENCHGRFVLNLQAQHPMVNGREEYISSIFNNVIDNAIKYSGEHPVVTISSENTNDMLVVRISDNGLGIRSADQKRVFDPYFRVDTGDVHDVKGFGIGLTYARKMAMLLGGELELESELNKGTTLILMLKNA